MMTALHDIRYVLMYTNKLCLAGFLSQDGDINEALLELELRQMDLLRTLSRNHGLQTDYFEKEVEEKDRQMQEFMYQAHREDRNSGERER